ncbi:MAG: hypothetical protein H6685_08340 [Deltaproteobacteria bacterium]|nr:hypothetical protein [Deltaproteobacteria bacterium]
MPIKSPIKLSIKSSMMPVLSAVVLAVGLAAGLAGCEKPAPPPKPEVVRGPTLTQEQMDAMKAKLLAEQQAEQQAGGTDAPAPAAPPRQAGTVMGEAAPSGPPSSGGMPPMMAMRMSNKKVDEPASVAEKFQGIKLMLVNKKTGKQTYFDVPLREETKLGDTGFVVTVLNLLPTLQVDDAGVTSVSDELRNPGAKLQIVEEGQEPMIGWSFQRMPQMVMIEHPIYVFQMVEALPKG